MGKYLQKGENDRRSLPIDRLEIRANPLTGGRQLATETETGNAGIPDRKCGWWEAGKLLL